MRAEVLWCADLGLASKPGEAREAFRGRLALAAREARDARVEALRKKYAPRRAALETKIARADAAVAREEEQAGAEKMQTAISIGSGLLGVLLGGRKLGATNVTRFGSALRGVNRSVKESGDVARAKEAASALRAQLDELEGELAAVIAGLGGAELGVETVSVRPALNTLTLRLAWVPEGV